MDNGENKCSSRSPYVLVALCCAAASLAIVFFSLMILRTISDGGMFAIALMTFAPAFMGVGIAYFMSKQPSKS